MNQFRQSDLNNQNQIPPSSYNPNYDYNPNQNYNSNYDYNQPINQIVDPSNSRYINQPNNQQMDQKDYYHLQDYRDYSQQEQQPIDIHSQHYTLYGQDTSCIGDIVRYFKQRVSSMFYIILLILIVYIVLEYLFIGSILRDFSNYLMLSIQSNEKGFFYYLYWVFSMIGKEGMVLAIKLVILLVPNNQMKVWTMVSYTQLNFAFCNLLKYIYADPRPYFNTDIFPRECDFGFGKPSGHAYMSFMIMFIIYYEYVYKRDENYLQEVLQPLENDVSNYEQQLYLQQEQQQISGSHNYIILIILIIIDILICISRIYMGVHDLSQVVLGTFISACSLGLYIVAFRSLIMETIQYLNDIKVQDDSWQQKESVNRKRLSLTIKYSILVLIISLIVTLVYVLGNTDNFKFSLKRIQSVCKHKIVKKAIDGKLSTDFTTLKMHGFYSKAYISMAQFSFLPIVFIGVLLRSWIKDYLEQQNKHATMTTIKNKLVIILILLLVLIFPILLVIVMNIISYFISLTGSVKIITVCMFFQLIVGQLFITLFYFSWFQILIEGEFRDELYEQMFTGSIIQYFKNKLSNSTLDPVSYLYFSYYTEPTNHTQHYNDDNSQNQNQDQYYPQNNQLPNYNSY